MAFPAIQGSIVQTTYAAAGATKNVVLPGSIAAGELLIAIIIEDRQTAMTVPSGWTVWTPDKPDWSPGDLVRARVMFRVADGSEGSTIAVVQTSADEMISYTMRVTGYELPIYVARTADGGGSSTAPDPPPHQTWDANDGLWIAFCGMGTNTTASAYPTDYSDNQATTSVGSGGCGAAIATQSVRAQSQDPGAFTIAAGATWVAGTLLVRSPA